MRCSRWIRSGLGAACIAATIATSGCVDILAPETALNGTWELQLDEESELTRFILNFDLAGKVTRVTFEIGDTGTFFDDSPTGSGDVDGQGVSVAANFEGNAFTFEGTLNSDKSLITGRVTTLITVGTDVVSIDNADGQFVKQ